jgi:hypothetical protein
MKNTYLIIGGGTAVLLLLAIWLYLLIYGTPKPVENFFTDFSFGGSATNDGPLEPYVPEVPTGVIDVASTPLRQLTTKPVIGFRELPSTDADGNTMLYAEAGTGHVYSINLTTGAETRLSNITIPNAQAASFTKDGTKVAIRSGYGTQNTIELLTLAGENSATQETLLPKMVDFTFIDNGNILYSEYSSAGILGREYNTATGVSKTLFSVPFQSAAIVWSKDSTTPTYVYTKPTAKLTGFLYRIANGVIVREQVSGGGLMALANDMYVVHTITTTRGPISYVTDRATGKSNSLPIVAQPDKCAFTPDNSDMLYCGYEENKLTYDFPDNWFKGLVSFSDTLWEIDLKKGLAAKLIDTEKETGRELDSIGMNMSDQNKVLYFINKNDNTLWMYEI